MNTTHHDEAEILFACSQCGQDLSCPSAFAGRKFNCPECSTMDFVPDQSEMSPEGEHPTITSGTIHLFHSPKEGKGVSKWATGKSEFPLRPMRNVTKGNKFKALRKTETRRRPSAAPVQEEQLVLTNVDPGLPAKPNKRAQRRSNPKVNGTANGSAKVTAKVTAKGPANGSAKGPAPANRALHAVAEPAEPEGPRKSVGEILQSLKSYGFEISAPRPEAPAGTSNGSATGSP